MDGKGNTSGLSIVVLGGKKSGKTSVVNTLLGQVVKSNGQLRGRSLTVVDTPGWWKDYTLIDTAERIKHELQLSVRLCPPGPNAFILTVEIDKFTKNNQKAIQEHLGLFGENIWGHTIVVFTKGEYLKGRTIEQHIESEGEPLKWLVEKCGNRYCVFEKQTADQIIELVEQIESAEDNNGRHFELDEETLKEAEEKKRAAEERAYARQLKVAEKKKNLEGQIQPLSEIRIVMLGWVSCGKSSAKNFILGKEDGSPPNRTEQCEKETGLRGDRSVTIVDTPGWWKYFSAQYTPEWVRMEIHRSVTLGSKSPHALLLVVPADVSFLEEQRGIIEENMTMFFGEMAWRHTLILFSWGDTLRNTSIEEHIESEGEPLRWLVEKCGNRYHVFDNINRTNSSQVHQLLEKIEEMEASVSLNQEAPESEATEAHTQIEVARKEMVEYLDKEWTRRDKELEKHVRMKWQEMFGTEMPVRGNRSLNHVPNFQDASSDPREERRLSAGCQQLLRISLPRPATSFSEIPGQAEHEQTGEGKLLESLRREWARREAIIMEKVSFMISELQSQSVAASEPGQHEIEESRQKVMQWRTGTSGLGSELEDEDISC